ncbi:hypothetical protein WA026_023828 [Henosepilachna vigintioctopunctata]|uniref:Uncharacterized protein n=1 Tax=Henosepilachna vigintioctopunctata TaxID=420089 RepID=A0AAW1VCX6_9CUCU
MLKYYECCKKKEFSHAFCIVCFKQYHISCLERKSSATRLENGLLLCSTECQNRYSNDNNKKKQEIDYLERLNKENNRLNEFITKSQDESNMVHKTLKEEIERLDQNDLSLTAKKGDELLEQIDELNQIKKIMLTSVEVLSEEKSLNQKEMENLKWRVKDVELINLKEEVEIVSRNAELKED